MKVKIYPYKLGSESARALATELETLCVKPDGRYRPYHNHLIINWGNSNNPTTWELGGNTLNRPEYVRLAVNKLRTLEHLMASGVRTPDWTTDYDVAYNWLASGQTEKIVLRHNLTGSRGEGIEIVDGHYEFEHAPLYTKFIERAREYRVHVFDGRVIDIQQKKRREGNDSDGTIKNVANGWVFVRQNITPPPEDINETAIRAVTALGLDFGAVDILTKEGLCYVLEVNTACGLEGATLTAYTNAIKRYANK